MENLGVVSLSARRLHGFDQLYMRVERSCFLGSDWCVTVCDNKDVFVCAAIRFVVLHVDRARLTTLKRYKNLGFKTPAEGAAFDKARQRRQEEVKQQQGNSWQLIVLDDQL